ncbi:GTPase family protein [Castellaniella defragrans]|uniref:GTPase family protein n=1 Tax=Castellaniella defragrans TaxID=75697 RepID=UPI002AFF2493|nr:GTPase [Castellaniella defragrans]
MIGDLISRYPAFRDIKRWAKEGRWHEWSEQGNEAKTLDKLVIFIGKTGYGKSTTVNAISGLKIMKTSAVEACTRTCQSVDYHVDGNRWFALGDLPGIGENKIRDKKYLKIYADFLGHAAAIVYILRADTRDYSIDEHASEQLFKAPSISKRVIYALGQCDKIEPMSRSVKAAPTAKQLSNIDIKLDELMNIFLPANPIIPYSAETGWGLNSLTKEIVRVSLT